MALYQSADGTWGVDYRDEWGTRHRKPVGSHAAAQAVLDQLRQQRAQQKAALANFQHGSSLTTEEARDLYLAQIAVSDRTRSHMKQRIDVLLRSLAQHQVEQITPRLITTWLEERRQLVSAHTLHRDVRMYRQWFHWLRENWYLPLNPFAAIHVPAPHATTARAITYEEEAALLEILTDRTKLRVLLALDAGLSLGEIAALRRNRIDFHEATLTSFRHKTKRTRTIPLTTRLRTILWKSTKHLSPDALVCSLATVKLQKGSDFLKRARRRLGTHFRFHDLRHTFATRIAAATPNPFAVAALLGHTAPRYIFNKDGVPLPTSTTLYVHPPLEELRTAIVTMEEQNPNSKEAANNE